MAYLDIPDGLGFVKAGVGEVADYPGTMGVLYTETFKGIGYGAEVLSVAAVGTVHGVGEGRRVALKVWMSFQ